MTPNASSTQWNDPKATWPLASFERTSAERREPKDDRRADAKRKALGERRTSERRSLRSLLKL